MRKGIAIRPVTFRYTKPCEDGEQPLQYGLVAEEVAAVFPNLVVLNPEGQAETVKYRLHPTLLLNEMQKQKAEIEQSKKIRKNGLK